MDTKTLKTCTKCLLNENVPDIVFDDQSICNFCNNHQRGKKTETQSLTLEEVKTYLTKYKRCNNNDYDALVAVSGGSDSCITLVRIVEEFGLTPLVFHNDHGYENPTQLANVCKLCNELAVDLIVFQKDLNFMKKLWKYTIQWEKEVFYPCSICGQMIYMNSIHLAEKFNIPLVINGMSKGQVHVIQSDTFMTESTYKMLQIIEEAKDEEFKKEYLSKFELGKKIRQFKNKFDFLYHNPDKSIMVLPLFIFDFFELNKERQEKILKERFNWEKLENSFPRRTTNCDMIWLITHFELKKYGYSLYSIEYSELIREGEMTREQALNDLVFDPPEGLLDKLKLELGLKLDL